MDRAQSAFAEFREAVIVTLPAMAAATPFAFLLGALATDKGLSVGEAGLMSALVFAGSAQFIALDSWTMPPAWLALGIATFVVNARHIFMSASVLRHMQGGRIATVAPSTPEIMPVPTPLRPPHSSASCHGSWINALAAMLMEMSTSAITASMRGPKRSMSQPLTGAVNPSTRRPMDTAKEMTPTHQFVSSWRGTRKTPGAERTPAETSNASAVTPTTIQP